MIFQQVYGFGSAEVTIKGAPGETVTMTGRNTGTVALNSSGDATVTIKCGSTTFTGGVSGYEKTAKVMPTDTLIELYPEGYVYWFGRIRSGVGHNYKTYKVLSNNSTHSFDFETNYCRAYLRNNSAGSNYPANACKTHAYFSGVDYGEYTSLKINVKEITVEGTSGSGYSYIDVGQANTTTTDSDDPSISPKRTFNEGDANPGVYTLTLNKNSSYISFLCRRTAKATSAGTTSKTTAIKINAVWLE